MSRARRSVLFILAAGLMLSYAVAGQFHISRKERASEFFDRIARSNYVYASKNFEWRINALDSVSDYFLSAEWVSPKEFRTFIHPLVLKAPGYDVIGWISRIDTDNVAMLRERLGQEGMTLPQDAALPAHVFTRVDSHQPMDGLIGQDVRIDRDMAYFVAQAARARRTMFFAHEPVLFFNKSEAEAQRRANDVHGHLFVVTPALESDGRIKGFAFSKLDLVQIIRMKFEPGYQPMAGMTVTSVDAQGHRALLYNSVIHGVRGTPYGFSRELQLNGITLKFDFLPTPHFLKTYGSYQPAVVFAMMIIMTLLAAFYIDRMQRTMAALEDANRRAEESGRLKNEFMATMSHEIRSPMTGVLGMAELLLEGDLTDEQRGYGRTIVNSAESLLTIINDILDFSRIEANRLELEPVPVNLLELIDDVAGLHSIKAREKAVELAVRFVPGTEQFVFADPTRLRQVLSNLIGNAVKFTEKGSIVVTVRETGRGTNPAEPDNIRFSCTVEDTGIGIPIEQQMRIFDKFYQLDGSMRRDAGGMGLGLSICRRLAEMMGGDIGVASTPGQGSVFTFTFTLAHNSGENYEPVKPAVLHGVRALIVDDLPVIGTVVSEQLNQAGMRCSAAGSGQECLGLLQTAAAAGDPYRIVIVDYLMPDMDGDALARAINDTPQLADTCLVMLSGSGLPVREDEFLRKGFSAHIAKPVRGRNLVEAIALIWRKYGAGEHKSFIRLDSSAKPAEAGPGLQLQGARILVAEDNRINQAFTEDTLNSMGCSVTIVPNGQEAVRAVQSAPFDLVLMDCQMPLMDGFEATRQICALKSAGKVPADLRIIALTANSMKGDRERCREAGMDDYLSKPVRSRELRERVHFWVARKARAAAPESPAQSNVVSFPGPETAESQDLLSAATVAEAKRILKLRYDTFLSVYIEDTNAYIQAVRSAVNGGDMETAIRPAHTIKSSSRQMGATRLGDQAERLEKSIRDMVEKGSGERDSIGAALKGVEETFQLTREALLRQTG